jgi:hypothetical protein
LENAETWKILVTRVKRIRLRIVSNLNGPGEDERPGATEITSFDAMERSLPDIWDRLESTAD